MTPIRQHIDRELHWTQPSAARMEYELKDGDDVLMTLGFRSVLGSLATLKGADGCWTFKRVGFFKTRITIRACESEKDVATFHPNTWASVPKPKSRSSRSTRSAGWSTLRRVSRSCTKPPE